MTSSQTNKESNPHVELMSLTQDISCFWEPAGHYELSLLQVETVKKFAAGSNKTGAGQDAAKLDRETEELHHDR